MESGIDLREPFGVLGVMERFNDDEEDVGAVWKRCMARHDQIEALSVDERYHGVSYRTGREWDYLAGMVVNDHAQVREGLVLHHVPAGRWAVFQTTIDGMNETFRYAYEQWFPASPYERGLAKPVLDVYVPGTDASGMRVWLYIPL